MQQQKNTITKRLKLEGKSSIWKNCGLKNEQKNNLIKKYFFIFQPSSVYLIFASKYCMLNFLYNLSFS